jgi:Cu-Zn family superoxide dismutase
MRGLTSFTFASALLLAGCGGSSGDNGAAQQQGGNDSGPLAEAPAVPLVNASGEIIGEVRGGDSDEGATLQIDARGLPPGIHGFHIHDVGLCEPPDFKSAGPHWNPTDKKHGGENPEGSHMGDLQNVTVAQDGTLQVRIVVPGTYLSNAGRDVAGGAQQILDPNGAAIAIHAKADDYKTDPSGDSGDRIACAVLGSPAPGAVVNSDNAASSAANNAAAAAAPANSASEVGNSTGNTY